MANRPVRRATAIAISRDERFGNWLAPPAAMAAFLFLLAVAYGVLRAVA